MHKDVGRLARSARSAHARGAADATEFRRR
jgi:hypothetical protein